MSLEIFVWAIIGGLFLTILSALAATYQGQQTTNKQLSRDFLIGAVFTGFLFPLIPESFNEIKTTITSTASDLTSGASLSSVSNSDPGVKIGPANF
jgi:formate/nitrite transporter FocA (FNT family)